LVTYIKILFRNRNESIPYHLNFALFLSKTKNSKRIYIQKRNVDQSTNRTKTVRSKNERKPSDEVKPVHNHFFFLLSLSIRPNVTYIEYAKTSQLDMRVDKKREPQLREKKKKEE